MKGVKERLCSMMFLEYAVKGIWILQASAFLTIAVAEGGLGFSEREKGLIVAFPLAIGAILSPFVGQLCDRKFATEKCLGVLLFFTGILKVITAEQTSFVAWLLLATGFAILYSPSVSLTNSLAMRHLSNPKVEFPRVRLWGTVGWIAVAWGFPALWLMEDLSFKASPPFYAGAERADIVPRMIDSLTIAGVIAMGYGVFCWLVLPKTPPAGAGKTFSLAEVKGLLRKRSYVVLLVTAFVISSIHTFYFIQMSPFFLLAGLAKSSLLPALSIGQVSEVIVMAFLGKALTRFGFRKCIAFGALCYAIRYGIFAMTELPLPVFVGAQVLHGLCFGFFFAASFIYVDRIAPVEVKHSSQTLLTMVIFGLGPLTAGWMNGILAGVSGTVEGKLTMEGFGTFWGVAAGIAAAGAVGFWVWFRDEVEEEGA